MIKFKTVRVVVLSVALALGSGGCSWLFVQPLQPNYERGDLPNCTSNVAAPVIDTIFTTLDTIELVSVAGASGSTVQNKNAVLTGATLGIITWGASAIYGYRHTSECSDAMAEPLSYHPYRRPRSPTAYRPPAAPPPPPPGAAPAPEEAAAPPAPTVTVPSGPPAPQQRDDE